MADNVKFTPYLGVGSPPVLDGQSIPLNLVSESVVLTPGVAQVIDTGIQKEALVLDKPLGFPMSDVAQDVEEGAPPATRGLKLKGPEGDPVELNKFQLRTHAFRDLADTELDFFGRIFGGSVKGASVGIIQEAKVFCDITYKGLNVEYGVSVRVNVAASEIKADMDLNFPNLAAAAQLGSTEARMEMSVWGYSGPLGEVLPAPTELDLMSYVAYVDAFAKTQQLVLGERGLPFRSPAFLGSDTEAKV
ncbi:MAG: hypothetical protein AAFZ02_09640 [Pseudomonadota bacterium]